MTNELPFVGETQTTQKGKKVKNSAPRRALGGLCEFISHKPRY
ncbi:hypothetical protein [Helicobacter marmotae]|nr:hypothetical protein [Helicobacter marmotae]